MAKIAYRTFAFREQALTIIARTNQIVADYQAQGYALTLRQVYYQFVSRDWLPAKWADTATGSTNNQRSYDKLGSIINDGRLAGLIDWTAIEDRTRELGKNSHWDSPADIIDSAARSFRLDKWAEQAHRCEVWVEKDALEGVVEKAARALDVAYFSCRGYTSQTSIWDAGQRLKTYARQGIEPVIIHLGDHDPSGIDMSRDIEDRLKMFMGRHSNKLIFRRIALNADQVAQYNPPPNPAKSTDSRYASYRDKYGDESWELDALDPSILDALIRKEVAEFRDDDLYDARENEELRHREALEKASSNWQAVAGFLEDIDDAEAAESEE